MKQSNVEELINALYDMIQDARALPLGADKCIVERDKVLDMLDDISAQLPNDLKEARTIVESRNTLINQARAEAQTLLTEAQEKAKALVLEEPIYQEARRLSEEMVRSAQERVLELKRVSTEYIDESLRQAEEAVAAALNDVRQTRSKFQALSAAEESQAQPEPAAEAQEEA